MTSTASPNLAGQPNPTRIRFARAARVMLWVVAVSCVALLCAADLFPQWLEKRSQPYLTFAAASFVVQTLQFHIGLVCLACFVVTFALRRRWRLSLVAGMGTVLGIAPTAFGLLHHTAPAPASATMRVMSMNVCLTNANAESVIASVRNASPDVLVLQEYTTAMDERLRAGLEEYPYQLRRPQENSDGWAVYSRRPLLAPIDTEVRLNDSTRQARFAVRMGKQEVLVYALHLTCPKSIDQIGANRAEVADLVEMVSRERMPVILAGDFNFTETTANFAALRGAGMSDTHDLAGNGRGSTWRYRALGLTHRLPGFRIDHVFVSPQLTCTNAQVVDVSGSDHRPIIADIAIAAPKAPADTLATVE
jgi:endonuclease/exonuclease/phosphatase (EEP) superfamily protein YafD